MRPYIVSSSKALLAFEVSIERQYITHLCSGANRGSSKLLTLQTPGNVTAHSDKDN